MRRKIKYALLLLLAALIAAPFLLPWKNWVALGVKTQLLASGFHNVEFTLGDVDWRGASATGVSMERGEIKITAGAVSADYQVSASPFTVDATWKVSDLLVTGTGSELPSLSGTGKASAQDGKWDGEGKLASADKKYHADFKLAYDPANPDASSLTVNSAAIPWHEGMVSTRSATLSLSGSNRFKATLEARKISLSALLQLLTSGRAAATGTVSGNIPVSGTSLEDIVVHDAVLKSDAPGGISLAPDALPANNPQVALVGDVLKNFHYKSLVMKLDSDDKKNLGMSLSLEGNNPDAYDGRAVKLNVHLTGDVLGLLRQSVIPLTSPEQWIKQYEKH